MPYGIQQPAVSGQISRLEAELGVRLFQRRPFTTTPAGQELYDFIAPFFGRLPEIAERISGKASRHLRLAAPALVIRDHLPAVISLVRKRQQDLELTLVEASERKVFELLEREEIDLAISELEGSAPSGVNSDALISLPLVLLLPPGLAATKTGIRTLAGKHPLIRTATDSTVARLFAKGLAKMNLGWPSRMEVSDIELVNAYVAQGFGVGVSVRVPGMKFPKGVKVLDLPDFPQLVIAGLWRGKLHPLAAEVLGGLRKLAKG